MKFTVNLLTLLRSPKKAFFFSRTVKMIFLAETVVFGDSLNAIQQLPSLLES